MSDSELEFSVAGTAESPARLRVKTRGFELVVDEPASLGGTDEAPNPVEYVLAGLAGCLNVVAHLVAQEQGIALRSLSVTANGRLNPAKLLNLPGGERPGFHFISATLHVDADADAATLEAWRREVAARCPVSDNLGNTTPLQVQVTHVMGSGRSLGW